MSLVAYGSSGSEDDSDSDENSSVQTFKAVVLKKPQRGLGLPAPRVVQADSLPIEDFDCSKPPSKRGMFSSLPTPKQVVSIDNLEDDNIDDVPVTSSDRKYSKETEVPTVKQRVKISVPSLADFKDDEDSEPKAKKIKPAAKGSGLLAILPEPKNFASKANRPMVPRVLTKSGSAPKPVVKKPVPKPATEKKSSLVMGYADSEEESGDEGNDPTAPSIDFFSLDAKTDIVAAEINLDDLLPAQGPSKRPSEATKKESFQGHTEPWKGQAEAGSSSESLANLDSSHSEAPQADLQLDDEALRKLCGRRGRRNGEDMNLIDLHGDAMMPDPKEWMLKQLTEEQENPVHRNSQPNSAHRRKHQITYLAFQAKEREIELKNQWASNRSSRKQTQAKYGF